ncbi:MAG: GIY-YIG nuclease family protein [Chitinophagales bacterium]|nr:GIY-YIG nuclease family protein [Chitinophagales bacterium]
MFKGGWVYIMASVSKRVLYVGVTSDIEGRAWEHKNKVYPDSFTAKYNCVLLVYYQFFDSIESAIEEEKRIKSWKRSKKEQLINRLNPDWSDLADNIEY